MNSYKNYLSHHGIKGQKWGVENGPPYPLNEVVKAVAYKGGDLGDGRRVENFTVKDVKKARKIVDKNLRTMTDKEIQEYKQRIVLEKSVKELLGQDTNDRLIKKLKNNAVDAVADSLKKTGQDTLTNMEKAALGKAIENIYGPDVAAMITDGLSKYALAKEKATTRKTNAEAEKIELENEAKKKKADKTNEQASKIESENEELKRNDDIPDDTLRNLHAASMSPKLKPKTTESASTSEPDYKYVDKEKVNGEWRYEYKDDVKALTDKHNPYKSSKSADEYVYKEYLKDLKKQRKQEVYNSKQIAKLEKKKLKQDIYNSKKLAKMEAKQYKQSALATKKAVKQLTAKRSNPIYLPNTRNDGIIYLPDKS